MALAVRHGGRPSLEIEARNRAETGHEHETRTHPTSLPEQTPRRLTGREHGARLTTEPEEATNQPAGSAGRAIQPSLHGTRYLRAAESAVPNLGIHTDVIGGYPAPLATPAEMLRPFQALKNQASRQRRTAESEVIRTIIGSGIRSPVQSRLRVDGSPEREVIAEADTRIGACRAGWPTAALRSARVHHDLLRLRPRVGAPALMSFGVGRLRPRLPGGRSRRRSVVPATAGRRRLVTASPRASRLGPAPARPPRPRRGVPRSSRIRPGAGGSIRAR